MKLNEFLINQKPQTYKVINMEVEKSETSGEITATLTLETPISIVTGSNSVLDDATGVTERLKAYDVDQVKIHQKNFDSEDVDIDPETRKGTVTCKDLRLDVSSRLEVWLTKESFNKFKTDNRKERSGKRRSGILTAMHEKKTKTEFKGVTAPVAPKAEIVVQ